MGENYMEKLANAVAKMTAEVIENITIEDVNTYKLGYNKAIDELEEIVAQINMSNGDWMYFKQQVAEMRARCK